MDEKFKIRSYGFGELAQLYFPGITKKSASAQLRKWIEAGKFLRIQLSEIGFIHGQKILTPKQVAIIIEFLGEP